MHLQQSLFQRTSTGQMFWLNADFKGGFKLVCFLNIQILTDSGLYVILEFYYG